MLFRAYKEQKYDLRNMDYETYVINRRDEYVKADVYNTVIPSLNNISSWLLSTGWLWSTWLSIKKSRPQPRI
jgi:hypothetical protein